MDYLQTVQLAIDYIEENLQRELYVEDVARRAWFSVYHFHRIFQSVVGDTVKEYIRKRRLTQAALALLHTDKRILDIAIDFQFESQESFTRSFQQVIELRRDVTARPRHLSPYLDASQFLIVISNK